MAWTTSAAVSSDMALIAITSTGLSACVHVVKHLREAATRSFELLAKGENGGGHGGLSCMSDGDGRMVGGVVAVFELHDGVVTAARFVYEDPGLYDYFWRD